jgi:hypothetical protein
MRSRVYNKVNIWPIPWDRNTHDVLGLLEDAIQIIFWLPHTWNTMFVIAEEFLEGSS